MQSVIFFRSGGVSNEVYLCAAESGRGLCMFKFTAMM